MTKAFYKNKDKLLVLALLFLPITITFSSLLGVHTVSYNIFRDDHRATRGINTLPVLDPAAGSYQDEPWSYFIGSSWAKGEIPFINQANGLGAPLLSSLQSGALYPGNLLLTLIPKFSPQFFDLYTLAHVVLLVLGLFTLGVRFTAEHWVAALIAGCFACSLAVVYNLNMVHFRAFSWAPWIALSLIDIVSKPGYNLIAYIAFALSVFCSFSAGNPQQSILDFMAAIIVSISIIFRESLYRRLWIIILAILCGVAIGASTLFPYLVSVKYGDLFSVSDPQRSLAKISITMLFDMVVPRGTGYGGNLWFKSDGSYALQFAWPVSWLLGFLGGFALIRQWRSQLYLFPSIIIFFLFITKILGFGAWNWVSKIPIVNGILFPKYTLYTAILLLPFAVSGFSFLVKRFQEKPTIAPYFSFILFLVFIGSGIGYLQDSSWQPNINSDGVKLVAMFLITSICGAVFLPFLISLKQFKFYALIWSILMSLLLRPAGFSTELPYQNATPYGIDPQSYLVASDFTDENWENGVSRTNSGFLIADSKYSEILAAGDLLTFESGRKIPIKMISGNQVWLSGENKLDPLVDGYPQKIMLPDEVQYRFQKLKEVKNELSQTWPRVVDPSYSPNTNLILGHASPWVFDPVMNARYRDLMLKEFKVSNPFFNTEPLRPFHFTERQVDVLRMLGVAVIYGSQLDANSYYANIGSNIYIIKFGLLPEGLLIPEKVVTQLSALFTEGRYGDFVNLALNVGTPCTISLDGPNRINAEVPPTLDSRRLLLNRVFMSGWKTSNCDALPLANFWLSTPVGPAGGKIVISYWPPGLTLGMTLAGVGVIGLTLLIYLDHRMGRLC